MRVFVAVVALLALLAPAAAAQSQSQYFNYGPVVEVPELMVAGPLGDKGLGDPKAPITVIEYASMTCPHCQRFHLDTFPALKSKYIDTGQVYFILREFPLDPLAMVAFMIARCSGDRYFDVVDTLFAHQDDWAYVQEPLKAIAPLVAPLGVGAADIEFCRRDQAVLDHINFTAERGAFTFGVEGTPTFFFNGNRIVGQIPVAGLDQIVGAVLNPAPRVPRPSTAAPFVVR